MEKQVELKDKTGSFYDPATGFEIVRDQVVDYPENVGQLTAQFLGSGHIVEVVPDKKTKAKAGEGEGGGTPDPNANK